MYVISVFKYVNPICGTFASRSFVGDAVTAAVTPVVKFGVPFNSKTAIQSDQFF